MAFRRTVTLACCLTLSLASCLARPTAAQNVQQSKDEQELQAYTLTMDNVTHALQATAAMQEAAKNDPSLRSSMKENNAGDSQQTLDQMAAKLSSSPKVVAILSSYSLTPRNYALTIMSLVTTGMAVAAIDVGAKADEMVTKAHINPANIAFARAHKAELEELGKKYPMGSAISVGDAQKN